MNESITAATSPGARRVRVAICCTSSLLFMRPSPSARARDHVRPRQLGSSRHSVVARARRKGGVDIIPLPESRRGEDTRELAVDVGEDALQELPARAAHAENRFVARVDPATDASEAREIQVLVDTRKLHFFDPESGEAIYD
jgi:hypothetical protein